MKRSSAAIALVAAILVPLAAVLFLPVMQASGAPILTITPLSWGVIGLDSNNVNVGPNTFQAGARVCNTGDATASNLTATFNWTTTNSYINLSPGTASTLTRASLAAGACTDFYFNITVTRTASAQNTTRGYDISASATGVGTVSTPANRELFVELILSQNRNTLSTITGPTVVTVGSTVNYTVTGGTATQGYEQLVFSTYFSNSIFQILNVAQSYSAPPNATNDREYADACGWDPVVGSPTYRSCIGPPNYTGGKAGGQVISSVYTVKVIGTGSQNLIAVILDFSGSSYHYNSDYGDIVLAVTAVGATPTPTSTSTATAVPTSTSTATSTNTATATETTTPTSSATVTPTPTSTATYTSTPTSTPSGTVGPTGTSTGTSTPTPSRTITPTPQPSGTITFSAR